MANPLTFKYKFSDLDIDSVQIERLIGFDTGTVPEPIPEMIDSALKAAEKITDIRGNYIITDGKSADHGREFISINNHSFHTGKIVTRFINESEHFLFFIVTAGKEIELQSKKLLKGNDPLLGYIYDVLGSLTVESALDKFLKKTEADFLQTGLKTTNPYSPGYCGWPVSDQQNLFSLFGNETCGIKLSESCLMNPIKSISGAIGIGSNVTKQPYSCTICDAKNCLYRNRNKSASP